MGQESRGSSDRRNRLCFDWPARPIYSPPNRDVRFIYLSTPSGYLPKTEQTIPLFYQKLNPAKQDIYDFELVRNPQNEINHLFLVQADAQVTSEDDVKAYAKYLQDMKEYIRPYMGKKKYSA